MSKNDSEKFKSKSKLHSRNRHRSRYDFEKLVVAFPVLKEYVAPNKYGDLSIDFSNPLAVKALNKALLVLHYNIAHWDIPEGYLCPPIPGRSDYLHYIADLLAGQFEREKRKKTPKGIQVRVLDIGTGANLIYPLLGQNLYDWSFVGSETDELALKNASVLIELNGLQDKIKLRVQQSKSIFESIIHVDEQFYVTICNPPFHSSKEEAIKGIQRKNKNLKQKSSTSNFGGRHHELWIKGGERAFITQMIEESTKYKSQVKWFTSLVSREANLKYLIKVLKKQKRCQYHVIPMGQGNKVSRILAWRFHEK